MQNEIVKNITPLGFVWQTQNPFLFCVHHNDDYPKGNEKMGPAESLEGRNIGQDFTIKDGWRMYHGEKVPGFPTHPHRGFETVTIVLNGFVDHSDSHGGAGRYGNGDVQWMTAGSGLQHSEMFPLLNKDQGNPLELFQIWLNLPREDKFVKPHYAMLWAENIPLHTEKDENGKTTEITVVAGKIHNTQAPPPAPNSWANNNENEVSIWLIKMEANASWIIPRASNEIQRSLYFYKGSKIKIDKHEIESYNSIELSADEPVLIENSNIEAYMLLLQGKPINEPVVQHGPFVMNTENEIRQAFVDYRSTNFGGWPWPSHENVHGKEKHRFAKYANGEEEFPGQENKI